MSKIKITLFTLCILLSCCIEVSPNRIKTSQDKIHRTSKLKNIKGRWDNKSNPLVGTLIVVRQYNSSYTQVRLDFKKLILDSPNANGVCDANLITFSGQSVLKTFSLCGNLTDQHLYLHFNNSEDIVISIGNPENLEWNIEIIQLQPTDFIYAPENCSQYYTNATGFVRSFNYDYNATDTQQIGNLDYNICISTQNKFCKIRYITDGNYSITTDATVERPMLISGESLCPTDYLDIGVKEEYDDETAIGTHRRICGATTPMVQFFESKGRIGTEQFQITVLTDADEIGDVANIGFSFAYFTNETC